MTTHLPTEAGAVAAVRGATEDRQDHLQAIPTAKAVRGALEDHPRAIPTAQAVRGATKDRQDHLQAIPTAKAVRGALEDHQRAIPIAQAVQAAQGSHDTREVQEVIQTQTHLHQDGQMTRKGKHGNKLGTTSVTGTSTRTTSVSTPTHQSLVHFPPSTDGGNGRHPFELPSWKCSQITRERSLRGSMPRKTKQSLTWTYKTRNGSRFWTGTFGKRFDES